MFAVPHNGGLLTLASISPSTATLVKTRQERLLIGRTRRAKRKQRRGAYHRTTRSKYISYVCVSSTLARPSRKVASILQDIYGVGGDGQHARILRLSLQQKIVGPVLLVDPQDDLLLPKHRCAPPALRRSASLLVPKSFTLLWRIHWFVVVCVLF